MHQFLKFIFGIKLYMFRTVPPSIIRSFSLYTQQWYVSYRFADSLRAEGSGRFRPDPAHKMYDIYTVVCTVKNSWWWTEELSETFRVLFQIINLSLRAGSGRNRPDHARKLSANLYDIYHCCVYSEILLMMNRGTVRNMWNFIPKINLRY